MEEEEALPSLGEAAAGAAVEEEQAYCRRLVPDQRFLQVLRCRCSECVDHTGKEVGHRRKLDIKPEPRRQTTLEASFTRRVVEEQLPGGEYAAHLRLYEDQYPVTSTESAKLWLVTVEWQFVMRRGGVYAYWERALSGIGATSASHLSPLRSTNAYKGTVHLRPPNMRIRSS